MTEEDDRLVRCLRDAIDPGLAPGAAERIAAGAWERAAELRAAPQPRFRVLRRTSWAAAAAAVVVAATVLAVRGSEAAFAVEGDPVKVQRGGAWVETSRVATDALVEVPAGTRVLHFSRGGTLRPQPGSLFRLVRGDDASRSFRVEFQKGGGDVDGNAFEVRVQSVDVQPDPVALAQPLAFSFTVDVEGPRVCVDSGRALVRSLVSPEKLVVNATESAAMLRVTAASQPVASRLMMVTKWTAAAQASITSGKWSVVDAGFGAKDSVMLVGQDAAKMFTAVEIPQVHAASVFADIKRRAVVRLSSNYQFDSSFFPRAPLSPAVAVAPQRIDVQPDARTSTLTYTDANGKTTTVCIGPTGVRLGSTQDDRRFVFWTSYPDVATFKAAKPEIAALFGDELR